MIKLFSFFLISLILIGCSGKGGLKDQNSFADHPVISKNGMVVSAHRESSRIGVEILKRGGNAVDAAVATELALAVCYPEAGNIGGGGFMVIRTHDGKADVIDYREKAPQKANRDMYLDSTGSVIEGLSTDTHLASGVPGTIDGIYSAHRRYGKLPFKDVIQPAIDIAENGFVITKSQAESLNSCRTQFIERNVKWPAFVKDSLWREGEILRQPDLAGTLRLVRDQGRDGFYKGRTAELIEKEMKRGNGIITRKDLEEYKAVWRRPLTGYYRGYRIISTGPPSSGGTILLQLLGISENYTLKEWGFHSVKSVHLIAEAERRVFADRAEFLGDPDFVNVPLNGLMSKEYLKNRMQSFNPERASLSTNILHGSPEGYISEETTHYSVVDSEGNAVSTTTTLNGGYGSCIVVDSAGFLLNNQMDDFSVSPGFPNMYGLIGGEANSIKAGKRMLSSMTPTIIEKEGKLFLVVGSPGGSTIPTSVYQVIINTIDFGMSIPDAVGEGRFHHQWMPDYILYENGSLDSLVVRTLESMGHIMKTRSAIGRVNAIMVASDGSLVGGPDPRGENVAVGF
jgi:gamma-glutamyltranspeptidase/glutathione hydrolase